MEWYYTTQLHTNSGPAYFLLQDKVSETPLNQARQDKPPPTHSPTIKILNKFNKIFQVFFFNSSKNYHEDDLAERLYFLFFCGDNSGQSQIINMMIITVFFFLK